MKKGFIFLLLFFSQTLYVNAEVSQVLSKEKSVMEGELANGFKYSVLYNKKPKNRVELRLLVKVGSLEEEDEEQGVAHFIEHMAFNGSKNFKKNELIDYLESIGVAFGSDLNANTSFEMTTYMLTVPLEKDNLEKSFMVFSDWASGITFDKEEFNKERGVVLEEARLGENVSRRLFDQYKTLIYGNSPYLNRLPIGKKEIIKNISIERAKEFYTTWYRPELMHFIAVGDFNTTKMEGLIKDTFSGLKNISSKERTARIIPENNTTRIKTIWDKEVTSNGLVIYYLDSLDSLITKEDKRRSLVDEMMTSIFAMKAQEQIEKENPKATMLGFSSTSFSNNRGAYSFSATYKGEDELAALKELYELIWSFQKYGFSQNSLDQVKSKMLASNEKSYAKIHDQSSDTLSRKLSFFADNNDSIFMDYTEDYMLSKELIKSIQIEEVNALFRKLIMYEDRVILFENSTGKSSSDEKVLSIIDEAKEKLSDVSQTKKLPKELKIDELKSCEIIEKKHHKETDIYEFTLDNGIKIAFKQTDFTKDQVILEGFSFGGDSLFKSDRLLELNRASLFVSNSGIGAYSMLDLEKILSDKSVRMGFNISSKTETISGIANTKDIETMFALIYLQLTQSKVDKRVIANIKNILKIRANEALHNPKVKFSREAQKYFYKNNERIQFETNESIERLDEDEILELFKERFSDLNNFMLTIIGDISLEEIERLSKKYFGNLPTKERKETFVESEMEYRKGEVAFVRDYNSENITHVSLQYKSKIPYSDKKYYVSKALSKTLNTRLRKLIREEESEVYSINASISLSMLEHESDGNIFFSCDPKRTDKLLAMIEGILDRIKKEPISQEELLVYKKGFTTQYETALRKNWFWLSLINDYYKIGTPLESIYTAPKVVEGVTAKDILELANEVFSKDKLLLQLNPKK